MIDAIHQGHQAEFDFLGMATRSTAVGRGEPAAPAARQERDAERPQRRRVRPRQAALVTPPADAVVATAAAGVAPEEATAERLIAAIQADDGIASRRKALLVTAVRTAARMVELALQRGAPRIRGQGAPVLTCEVLNAALWRHPPKAFGIEKGTFHNTVSALRQVLERYGLADPLPRGPERLNPEWRMLHDAIPEEHSWRRMGLVGLLVFCSWRGIAPAAVGDATLADFEQWLTTRTVQRGIHELVRRTASNWNWAAAHVPGWPAARLHRTDMRDQYRIRLDDGFPESLQADAALYLERLAKGDEGLETGLYEDDGIRPAAPPTPRRPRTVETRRYQLEMALTALVASGVPREDIRSLRDLVEPLGRVTAILRFHLERTRTRLEADGREVPTVIRSSHLAGIAETLRQVAKFHCALPDVHVGEINRRLKAVKPRNEGRMTERNLRRVRRLLEPRSFAMLLHLPQELMRQARVALADAETRDGPRTRARHEAARLAMHAAVLEIGLFCPMRRENLFGLRLDANLERDGQTGRITRLQVSRTKVDGVEIDWPVADESDVLLRTFIEVFRPILAAPGNPYLFPGEGLKARDAAQFATDMAQRVEEEIGAEFHMHLMRHFAVARFLRRHPGQYGIISKALGHRKIETTIRFYAGLEMDATAQLVNEAVFADRQETRLEAQIQFRGRGRPRGRTTR